MTLSLRPSFCASAIVLMGLVCPCVSIPASTDPVATPATTPTFDMICGPRCVRYILGCYGKPEPELIDLVREMQWPDLEMGASLASAEDALRARGIYTQALRLTPGARLRWPYPVIVHLKGREAGGHFVVRLPPEVNGEERVWAGLSGVRSGPPEKILPKLSGTVLLTAPAPITDPTSAAEVDPASDPRWAGAVGLTLVACVVVAGRAVRRRSAASKPARVRVAGEVFHQQGVTVDEEAASA